MKIGVGILPEYDRDETIRVWRRVEVLGAHHGWTFDHLRWRDSQAGDPWFDGLTTLAAAAVTTSSLRLGTLVSTPNYRHPASLAHQALTLDALSGGRITLGVGAGAQGPDSACLRQGDLTARARLTRFTEFVHIVCEILSGRTVDFAGKYYGVDGLRIEPGSVQRPRVPIAMAADRPGSMALAATHADMWVTRGDPRFSDRAEPEQVAALGAQIRRVDDACENAHRRPEHLGKVVNLSRVVANPYASPQCFIDHVGRCEELGFSEVVVIHPRAEGAFSGSVHHFEESVAAAVQVCCQSRPVASPK